MQPVRFELKSPDGGPKLDEDDLGLSSDNKYRLSMTPGSLQPQLGQDDLSQVGNSHQRIFSDLSAKVVNINNGGATLHNPFSKEEGYQSN